MEHVVINGDGETNRDATRGTIKNLYLDNATPPPRLQITFCKFYLILPSAFPHSQPPKM